MDRFNAYLLFSQSLLETDLRRSLKCPQAGHLAEDAWRLVEHRSEFFALGWVELGLHCFWPTGFGLQTIHPLLLKSLDGIAHRLGCAAQVLGNG